MNEDKVLKVGDTVKVVGGNGYFSTLDYVIIEIKDKLATLLPIIIQQDERFEARLESLVLIE